MALYSRHCPEIMHLGHRWYLVSATCGYAVVLLAYFVQILFLRDGLLSRLLEPIDRYLDKSSSMYITLASVLNQVPPTSPRSQNHIGAIIGLMRRTKAVRAFPTICQIHDAR